MTPSILIKGGIYYSLCLTLLSIASLSNNVIAIPYDYLQARSSSSLKINTPKYAAHSHAQGVSQPSRSLKAPHSSLPAEAPISLEFQKAPLHDVLQAFSAFTGTNLIISDQIQGQVSLKLDRVPWRDALDALLATQGLAMQQRGNIVWIAPQADIAKQEQQHVESQARAMDRAPLHTHIFEMHYQRAQEAQALLNGMTNATGTAASGTSHGQLLSKRGIAMADLRTNQLFVIDTSEHVLKIKHFIAAIDRPAPQVSIEAQIVEAEEGFSRSLGTRLSILGSADHPSPEPDKKPNKDTPQGDFSSLMTSGALAQEKGMHHHLPANALSGFNPASIGFTLFGAGASRIIALELSMLEAKGQGKILSSPRVVTADRIKAQIEQGMELPYQAKVGQGVSGVQFRRAGLRLEVTPHIMPNGYITLDVDVSKDSVGADTLSGPAIHTKHAQTQVHVEDAGTVAIGGIFTQDQRSDVAGLPGLSQLPFIGPLFRRSIKNQRKNELLIFITPHIIKQVSSHPAHSGELDTKMY